MTICITLKNFQKKNGLTIAKKIDIKMNISDLASREFIDSAVLDSL